VIKILHGRGSQYHLTKSYEKLRQKGLLKNTKLTDKEKTNADIEFPDGGGRTDPNNIYIVDSSPIPADRASKKVDIRKYPKYGIE